MMYKFGVLATMLAASNAFLHDRSWYEARFEEHVQAHNLKFDGREWVQRLEIFMRNNDLIETHNAQENKTYELGHNQFSHLTYHEWYTQYTGYERPMLRSRGNEVADLSHVEAASSVDWVSAGAVTPVKDQGSCGSCWSFSTTGALEGAYYLKYGNLVSFSEQQLVDCDGLDHGCNGGWMDHAFYWVGKNGGLCREEDYPYVSGTTRKAGTCNTSCQEVAGSAIKSHYDVPENNDAAFASALTQQPVSVAIDASGMGFQFYKSGVYTSSCGTDLDHGVLAVGYGTDNGVDYYKVKNSWGTGWGEGGYIRLQRGVNQEGGQCGILLAASYPTL